MTDSEADAAHQIHQAYSVDANPGYEQWLEVKLAKSKSPAVIKGINAELDNIAKHKGAPAKDEIDTELSVTEWFDGQVKKQAAKEEFKNLKELTDAMPKPKYVWDEPEPQSMMTDEEWAVLSAMKKMKEKSSFDDYISEKILSANYVPPTISTAVSSVDDLTYEKLKAEMAKMVGANPHQVSSKVFPAGDFNYETIGPQVPSKYLHPSAVKCTACGQGYASACCQVHTPEWTDLKICQPCYETLHGPDGAPGSTVHSMKVLIADKMSKALAKVEVKKTPGMSYSEWKQIQAQKKCSACQSPGATVCCPEHTPKGSGLAVCYPCYETLHTATGPHIPAEAAYIEDQLAKKYQLVKDLIAKYKVQETTMKPSCLWCGDPLAAACCEEHAPQGTAIAFCAPCKKILHGKWYSQTNINKQKSMLKVVAKTLEKAKHPAFTISGINDTLHMSAEAAQVLKEKYQAISAAAKGINMVAPNHPDPQIGDTAFDPQGVSMQTWDGAKWIPMASATLDHVSVSPTVTKAKNFAVNYGHATGTNGGIAMGDIAASNHAYTKTTYFTVEQKASVLIEESGDVTLVKKTYIVDLPDGDTCVLPAGSVIRALAPGEDPNSDD